MTKLDVLSGLPELKICVAYEYRGQRVDYPPQEQNAMAFVTPVYETLPGWREDITTATSFSALPEIARNYLKRMEELSGVPIGLISVGPDREQTFARG